MRNSMEAIGYQSQYIIVNGVRMTMTEYNKMKRAKNKAKRKKKEKSVYAYVQKLSYKMIETKECMQSLYDVVMGTNVINSPFATHEIISGTGRRLGLKILMYKTYDAIAEIDNIINKLHGLEEIPNSVYDNSRVMNYGKA